MPQQSPQRLRTWYRIVELGGDVRARMRAFDRLVARRRRGLVGAVEVAAVRLQGRQQRRSERLRRSADGDVAPVSPRGLALALLPLLFVFRIGPL